MTNYNGVLPPCRGQNERDSDSEKFIELVDSKLAELFNGQCERFGVFNNE